MMRLRPSICFSSVLLGFLLTGAVAAAEIFAAGASLPHPIYKRWADSLGGDQFLEYQPIGSGSGTDLLLVGKVDFAASDRPMKPEELQRHQLMQFPTVVGGVIPVVNIPGIESGQLKLDGETLARIFLGRIAKWNDPAIATLNRDLKLPDENIAVIYRADRSGSTFMLTNYLSKVSPEWRRTVGEDCQVNWKTGTGAEGGKNVAIYVKRVKNSIGYVDFNQVVQNNLSPVQLKNRDGQFVTASVTTIKAAAANAQWGKNPGFYEVLTDQQGGWPIAGATFVLMRKVQTRPEVAQAVLKFFDWGYSNGGTAAEQLNFVTLPADTHQLIRSEWKNHIRDTRGNAVW